ncbi:hypothetical protein M8R20_16545 [Pseudomonas sp. R2.Fl]|nr:hypothetical protein [Pseudomonas sp. R2.Fl]
MSDPANNAPPTDTVHVDHNCEHPGCKAWGSFGFDAGGMSWYCRDHRADGETRDRPRRRQS